MKLMVVGHAQHGKDSVAQLLCDMLGVTYTSSSLFVAERAVRPYLEARGIVYPSLDACYADRANHRALWYNAIREYNGTNPSRLGEELYDIHDLYCGLRNSQEFFALKPIIDCTFWVYASLRKPLEPETSMGIKATMANVWIDNNRTEEELPAEVKRAVAYARHCGMF